MKYIVKFSNWLESDNTRLILFVIVSALIVCAIWWHIGWL